MTNEFAAKFKIVVNIAYFVVKSYTNDHWCNISRQNFTQLELDDVYLLSHKNLVTYLHVTWQ